MTTRTTSAATFRTITDSGMLSAMRLRVYTWLYSNGPSTRSELDQGMKGASEVNPSYHKRLSELERIGLVETVGERDCRVTGRSCLMWRTTDCCVPVELPTRITKASALRTLCGEVADWLEDLNPKAAERIRVRVAEIATGATTE